MAQMMQRITAHSAYMETLTDQATLTQEMLRHQKRDARTRCSSLCR